MTRTGQVIASVVAISSALAFFLPPASKFDGYPRFQPVYNAFLIFVDWIALNKRLWYMTATTSSASQVDTKKIDTSLKNVTDATKNGSVAPKE